MGCRDVHAATVLSFLCGIASVAGLFAGTLLPNWRKLRLITFNRNEKNLTVYTGLWVKCLRYDGSSDCLMYDTTWSSSVDQLDLRVLQFALPLSILIAMGALLLCLIGMCNTAFRSSVPNIKLAKCLVNSAGCHLVAGLLFFLAVSTLENTRKRDVLTSVKKFYLTQMRLSSNNRGRSETLILTLLGYS
ncbi:claudin-12 isoform X3 [Nannospalax galili]|uniref:claudin-12 isoform X3 n=1 Tax=Nannospalax galili TaxID=1026970 RepID=UPI00111C8E8B|nr:claudin-12 isoform X3 [Nannospalax galili]